MKTEPCGPEGKQEKKKEKKTGEGERGKTPNTDLGLLDTEHVHLVPL